MTLPNLPKLNYPLIVLMVTDRLVPLEEGVQQRGAPDDMSWAVSRPHPFMPGAQIIAMFDNGASVDVYSIQTDESKRVVGCMREKVPAARVRIIQEAMPYDVFTDELIRADQGDDDDDPDVDDPEDFPPEVDAPAARVAAPVASASNGQVEPES